MGRREISSIKPDTIPGKQRPIPKISWNNKTIESYKENGFWDPEFPPSNVDKQERDFLQLVDERQGPIKRVVTRMVRLKAIDYTTRKEKSIYIGLKTGMVKTGLAFQYHRLQIILRGCITNN